MNSRSTSRVAAATDLRACGRWYRPRERRCPGPVAAPGRCRQARPLSRAGPGHHGISVAMHQVRRATPPPQQGLDSGRLSATPKAALRRPFSSAECLSATSRVPAGRTPDRKGKPLPIKLKGKVELFYRCAEGVGSTLLVAALPGCLLHLRRGVRCLDLFRWLCLLRTRARGGGDLGAVFGVGPAGERHAVLQIGHSVFCCVELSLELGGRTAGCCCPFFLLSFARFCFCLRMPLCLSALMVTSGWLKGSCTTGRSCCVDEKRVTEDTPSAASKSSVVRRQGSFLPDIFEVEAPLDFAPWARALGPRLEDGPSRCHEAARDQRQELAGSDRAVFAFRQAALRRGSEFVGRRRALQALPPVRRGRRGGPAVGRSDGRAARAFRELRPHAPERGGCAGRSVSVSYAPAG